MDSHQKKEALFADRLHWAVALTPLVTIALFYSCTLHAHLITLNWTGDRRVDPQVLSESFVLFGFHWVITLSAIIMTSISPIAWLILLMQAHLLPSLRNYGIRFMIYIGCFSLALWLGTLDPGRHLAWFMD